MEDERTATLPPLTHEELFLLEGTIELGLDLLGAIGDGGPRTLGILSSLRTAVAETRMGLER